MLCNGIHTVTLDYQIGRVVGFQGQHLIPEDPGVAVDGLRRPHADVDSEGGGPGGEKRHPPPVDVPCPRWRLGENTVLGLSSQLGSGFRVQVVECGPKSSSILIPGATRFSMHVAACARICRRGGREREST